MFEVWKIIPADSKLEEELKSKAKRRQIKKLLSFINNRIIELK
jgi:hypothetical protein